MENIKGSDLSWTWLQWHHRMKLQKFFILVEAAWGEEWETITVNFISYWGPCLCNWPRTLNNDGFLFHHLLHVFLSTSTLVGGDSVVLFSHCHKIKLIVALSLLDCCNFLPITVNPCLPAIVRLAQQPNLPLVTGSVTQVIEIAPLPVSLVVQGFKHG